ncbi:MAG: outer membrane beta-barrel protein [Bacteroidota bacterium]
MKWACSLFFVCLSLSFYLIPTSAMSQGVQAPFVVKGVVALESGELPSGNAMILDPTDSSLVTATFFLDGKYEVPAVRQFPFLLQLSSMEFSDTMLFVQRLPKNGVIELPTITVQSLSLEMSTVVVEAMRSAYRQKADGTVELAVANTLLATSNSVDEILSMTPEILIDDEGNLSIMGKGVAIIFLNGQRILPNQLATILPANIESIEIIRNPSARYDAEGNAVIHIHTISQETQGEQFIFNQNGEYSSYAGAKMLSSLQAQLVRKKFNLKGSYSFERGRDEFFKVTTRDRRDSSIFFSSEVKIRWKPLLNQRSRYSLGAQYNLDKDSYLSIDYTGAYEDLGGSISNQNNILDKGGQSQFQNETSQSVIGTNQSLSLNYYNKLDSLGSNIFIGAQYNDLNEDTNNPIFEERTEDRRTINRELLYRDNRNIRIATAQVDWTSVKPSATQWEVGVKGSYVKNGSATDFLVRTAEAAFEKDERLSNLFRYEEYIGAAYAALKGKWQNDWSYQLGVRAEYTDYAVAVSGQAEPIADRYLNWFPSTSLNYQLNAEYQFNLSYRAGINRQPYRSLNPALLYQDPYTSIQGNPLLIPERIQAIELTSQLRRLQLKIGYNYVDNPLSGAALRGEDDRSYILKRINYDQMQNWYASLGRTIEWGPWTSNNTLSATYTQNSEQEFGVVGEAPRINWYFYSSQQFRLPADFKLALIFWWQNDLYDGTIHREDSWNLTCSLERSFFNDQLQVRFIANDIFHTNRADGDYRVAETDITFTNKWNTNYFRLALSYRIGQIGANQFRNKKTSESEASRGN